MDKHFKSTDQAGFTLIELMIVVAIIAILTAIAIPAYIGIQKKAARSEAKANLPAIGLALETFYAENSNYGFTGVYTYICDNAGNIVGTFNHGGNIGAIANLGNELNYDYQITITQPQTAFTVLAIPMRGYVGGDNINPWLQSDGQKGPANFGW